MVTLHRGGRALPSQRAHVPRPRARAARAGVRGTGRAAARVRRKAGAAGILGPSIPERHGGPGASEICYAIVSTELRRSIGSATIGSALAIDLSTHMLVSCASEAQLTRLAPGVLSGELIPALALTEPDAGSDATAIRTVAVRDGDEYVITGSKTYITNGCSANLIYVVAKTDPAARGRG
ncbi:MAG: acyl-CoA dehydrogenase family protein [Steroidobacteraceae bacterium]